MLPDSAENEKEFVIKYKVKIIFFARCTKELFQLKGKLCELEKDKVIMII